MASVKTGELKLEVKVGQKNIKKETVHVVEVVRHGEQFVIPAAIDWDEAIKLLQVKKESEEKVVAFSEVIDCFPWDGAYALNKAICQLFGWANPQAIQTFFGEVPPAMVAIQIGPNEKVMVPWGHFQLPGVEGKVSTHARNENGQWKFLLAAEIKKKHEAQIKRLADLTRRLAKDESIYRGHAIKLRFLDNDGDMLDIPEIKFMDLSTVKEKEIVFSQDVEKAVSTSLYTPVERAEECRKFGIPLKRGILLTGPYGTGKTLAAYMTALRCQRSSWTFLYCERADELADVVKFAHMYQPAVIFCEDIDRVVTGERSIGMDAILNIVDGIDSKSTEIMVILTTNHVENINQAMLRPGRLDAIINVLPPDAEAVERLLRLYGRGLIEDGVDLAPVAQKFAGKIPAVIRECIERAKLSALKLTPAGEAIQITAAALLDAAAGMENQLQLLERKQDTSSDAEKLGRGLAKVLVSQGFSMASNGTHN